MEDTGTLIRIHDDKKERSQSVKAEFSLESEDTFWGDFDASFVGYGSDEWSAKQNLKAQVESLRDLLNTVLTVI
jgi:hypothetical protein